MNQLLRNIVEIKNVMNNSIKKNKKSYRNFIDNLNSLETTLIFYYTTSNQNPVTFFGEEFLKSSNILLNHIKSYQKKLNLTNHVDFILEEIEQQLKQEEANRKYRLSDYYNNLKNT